MVKWKLSGLLLAGDLECEFTPPPHCGLEQTRIETAPLPKGKTPTRNFEPVSKTLEPPSGYGISLTLIIHRHLDLAPRLLTTVFMKFDSFYERAFIRVIFYFTP